jgi:1,4-alpha-glucan branching enzyme
MATRARDQSAKSEIKRHRLALVAPDARSVTVTGGFCDWVLEGHPLKKGRDGVWTGTLTLPPGRHESRFRVDGEWRDDPECPNRVPNEFGSENCVIAV